MRFPVFTEMEFPGPLCQVHLSIPSIQSHAKHIHGRNFGNIDGRNEFLPLESSSVYLDVMRT